MGNGTVGFQGFGGTRSFELPAGSGAEVSEPGRAALRFEEVAGALQVSIDGAPYVTIPLGGGGSSPWLDDGAGTVRLQDTSNDVVIGGVATVGTERLRVVGDIRVDSQIQVAEVTTAPGGGGDLALSADSGNITATVTGPNGFLVENSVGDPLLALNPTSNEVIVASAAAAVGLVQQFATRTELNVGSDAAALDVREAGISRFTLDTVSNTISTGTAANPLDAVVHGNAQFNVPTADANAWRVRDSAGREYLNVDTQVGVETITVGNATTNPSVTFVGSGDVDLGTGTLRADGGIDRTSPGDLAIAAVQATSVTVGDTANPITSDITVPDNTADVFRVLDPAGLPYIVVTTTSGSEFVGFGNNTTTPDYFFQGAGANMVVGADASGQIEAASFGPNDTSFFSRPMFVGTASQATAITMGHAAAPLTIDSSDVTISTAVVTTTLPDNTAAALVVDDAAGDSYLSVVTTTGGEAVVVGNATNDPDFTVAGAGHITLGSSTARIGVLGAAAAPQTAAYTVTNPLDRRSFDTTTVALDELAQVVGTVIADLQTFGYFGS